MIIIILIAQILCVRHMPQHVDHILVIVLNDARELVEVFNPYPIDIVLNISVFVFVYAGCFALAMRKMI